MELRENEIKIQDIIEDIRKNKKNILSIIVFITLITIIVVSIKPHTYTAEAIIVPTKNEDNGLNGALSGLQGVAKFAGIQIGSSEDDLETKLAILTSRKFIIDFIKNNNIDVELFAKKFNFFKNEFYIDEEKYDKEKSEWKENGKGYKPSSQDLYKKFSNILKIKQDRVTNIITISITWHDANLATDWVNKIINEFNESSKEKEEEEAKKSILYLENTLKKTEILSMQQIIYGLIESQIKVLMLANAKEQYAFKIIDPALVPLRKDGPSKIKYILLAIIVSTGFSILLCVFREFYYKKMEKLIE